MTLVFPLFPSSDDLLPLPNGPCLMVVSTFSGLTLIANYDFLLSLQFRLFFT